MDWLSFSFQNKQCGKYSSRHLDERINEYVQKVYGVESLLIIFAMNLCIHQGIVFAKNILL